MFSAKFMDGCVYGPKTVVAILRWLALMNTTATVNKAGQLWKCRWNNLKLDDYCYNQQKAELSESKSLKLSEISKLILKLNLETFKNEKCENYFFF